MSDRIRTVDMSDPAVVLDCYRKLNVAYKELKAENEKLLERLEKAHSFISRADWMQFFEEEHAAAAALKETGDE